MYYVSGMPRVVGEFDAEALHQRIDVIAQEIGDSNYKDWEIKQELARQSGFPEYEPLRNVARIAWKGLFRPVGFGSDNTDGNRDDIVDVSGYNLLDSVWHPDTSIFSSRHHLPEILTGASRFPTAFLVGKIAVHGDVLQRYRAFSEDFWESEEGLAAINAATGKGNARVKHFKEGEVLRVPGGTLHRREIPAGASGYRYFLRQFPRIKTFHATSERCLMRRR